MPNLSQIQVPDPSSFNGGKAVSKGNPLPISENGVQGVTSINVPGRGSIVILSTAGNVDFVFVDGSTLTSVPLPAGLNIIPFSVISVTASSSGGAVLAQVKGAR